MHLEVESSFLELVTQKALDGGHLAGEVLTETGLPYLLTDLRRTLASKQSLSYFLPTLRTKGRMLQRSLAHPFLCFRRVLVAKKMFVSKHRLAVPLAPFRRMLTAKSSLPYLLASLRGYYPAKAIFVANLGLAHLFGMFGGLFIPYPRHSVFNFNMEWR